MESKIESIRILTYNIYSRPAGIHSNKGDYKDVRIKEFSEKHLKNYDIICLQEMFGTLNNRKKNLFKKAKELGIIYVAESHKPQFSTYVSEGGILILSRFPILFTKYFVFEKTIFPDSLCAKGVIYAKIQIYQSVLHLFTTHLQASYNDLPKILVKFLSLIF